MMAFALRRPTFWLLGFLLAVGAFVRFRALDFGLPHTQARPDETAIIDPVRTLLTGHLPHFYDYPWLFLWMLALAYLGYFAWGAIAGWFHTVADMLATWPTHYEPFFLIPRAISAAAGTITILVVYRLGRQIRDDATGLVAALFLTFSFMHVRGSHFGTTDVVMTLLIVGAITLLLDAHRTRNPYTFAAAGVVAGLAAATKYNGVVLVVPMIASHLLTVWDAPVDRRRAAWLDPRILIFGGAFLLAFAIGVPFVVVDQARFLDAMRELAHALRTGDVNLETTNGWWHHLIFSLRYGMGLPMLTLGLIGAVVMFWRDTRNAVLLLSFPIAYYALAGSLKLLFFRYVIPVVPFLCVTAAYLVCWGVSEAVARLPIRREPSAFVPAIASALVALAVVWTGAARTLAFDRIMAKTDSRVVVADWFEKNVPPGSTVVQSGSVYGRARFPGALGYREWRWDGGRRVFLLDNKRLSAKDAPEWIVMQDSPLPSGNQEILTDLVKDRYELVSAIQAFSASSDLVYDQQDMFFVPFSGFEHVVRPGPNFSVFKRKDAATDGDARSQTH